MLEAIRQKSDKRGREELKKEIKLIKYNAVWRILRIS